MPTTRRTCQGESGTLYRLVHHLEKQKQSTNPANVWKAVDDSNARIKFIAQHPSDEDDSSNNWPAFHHELKMQKLFADEPMIHPMLDFVPSSDSEGSIMIFQRFEQTLWEAQLTRPFTLCEIKWIMKGFFKHRYLSLERLGTCR